MALYEYTALNPANAILRGQVTGWSKTSAARQLVNQQLTVVTLRRASRAASWRRWLPRRVSAQERIVFTRGLMTMIKAGMNITAALQSTAEQTNNLLLKEIIHHTLQRIQAGQTLSASLSAYPLVFSTEYIAMVRIGEQSGKLVDVLDYVTKKLESEYRLLRKIRQALTYPTLIVIAMVVIIAIMMLFVIPRIASVYDSSGVALPIFTRIMIAVSHFFTHWWIQLFAGLFIAIVLFDTGLRRWPAMRYRVDGLILKLPIVGQVIKKVNLSIISRSLSMLLHAGLTIDQALKFSADAARNTVYRQSLLSAIPLVTRGVHISDVFRGQPQLYLPIFQRMIATGEQSGNLDAMLTNIANYYDDDIEYWSSNVSSVIEPTLIICIAVVVGSIAMAILYPLWNFVNVIN